MVAPAALVVRVGHCCVDFRRHEDIPSDLCGTKTWDNIIVILSPQVMFRSNSFILWSFCLPFFFPDEFQKLGIQCFYHNSYLADWANVIFLCCLPSQLSNICSEIQTNLAKACIVYSFVAAVPIPRYLFRVSIELAELLGLLSSGFCLPLPPSSYLLELAVPRSKVEAASPTEEHSWPFRLCLPHLKTTLAGGTFSLMCKCLELQ